MLDSRSSLFICFMYSGLYLLIPRSSFILPRLTSFSCNGFDQHRHRTFPRRAAQDSAPCPPVSTCVHTEATLVCGPRGRARLMAFTPWSPLPVAPSPTAAMGGLRAPL